MSELVQIELMYHLNKPYVADDVRDPSGLRITWDNLQQQVCHKSHNLYYKHINFYVQSMFIIVSSFIVAVLTVFPIGTELLVGRKTTGCLTVVVIRLRLKI